LKCQCANFIYCFFSADAAKEKEEKKVLLPTGGSKSAAHTVASKVVPYSCN
jgi:hypothetical protein